MPYGCFSINSDVYNDYTYQDRQKAFRKMERERKQGKLPLTKGTTWKELWDWARSHYGEKWYRQLQALEQDKKEEREAVDLDERRRKEAKKWKREGIISEMELATDEAMLAEGVTWSDIMAWPPQPNVLPAVEVGFHAPSPSSSVRSENSIISTHPPTPTPARRQAMDGPQIPRGAGKTGDVWNGAPLDPV